MLAQSWILSGTKEREVPRHHQHQYRIDGIHRIPYGEDAERPEGEVFKKDWLFF
jgi:hypothetical protein